MAFCATLRELREARRITQTELSALLGQPQSFVSKVEAGERKLDLRQFVLYVWALEADPVAVLKSFLKAFDATVSKKKASRREH